MPKVKVAKKSTLVDMTPMSDIAFLLVTFFMLTTKFKAPEPVEVITPSAISTTLLPESNVALTTVSNDGKVFFGLDNEKDRIKLMQGFNESYNLGLTDREIANYSSIGGLGLPIKELKEYLSMDPLDRSSFQQSGIPIDTTDGELRQWIRYTRNSSSSPGKLKFVVKADNKAKYEDINRVLEIFKDESIHRLHLITSMKAIPEGTPAYMTANSPSSGAAAPATDGE